MMVLDGGKTAVVWASACAVWNLMLIVDWVFSRTRSLRHAPWMEDWPAWLLLLMPLLLALPTSWMIDRIIGENGF